MAESDNTQVDPGIPFELDMDAAEVDAWLEPLNKSGYVTGAGVTQLRNKGGCDKRKV